MLDIQVSYSTQRKPSNVLLVDYFENSPLDFGDRFPKGDPFFELVKPAFDSGDFSGKWKQNVILYTYGKIPETRIMLVGLGKQVKTHPFQIKVAFGQAVKKLQHLNIAEISTFIDRKCNPAKIQELIEFLVEASYLSQYRHPSYKKEDKENPEKLARLITKLHFIMIEDVSDHVIQAGIKEGTVIGSTVNEVRDLVNKPSNDMTPTDLANHARGIARKDPKIQCEIFDRDKIKAMKMGGLIGVSQGSQEPPCFIKCVYTPTTVSNCPTVALVGKGVTFDSGGISIKPREGMYRMKDDMSGAALVMGIVKIASLIDLPLKIVALIPACENMPSGSALKPGDIITAYNNTTVEVYDTDAEGRLILMDALAYAASEKPDLIIDMATLTGACTIALGRNVIGGFTNHQALMDLMKASGDYLYERVWQMPLMSEYKSQLKSLFADLRNYGGREAGAVTAAVFLQHFVNNIPWIHLDIAGVSWFDTETSLTPEGASGIGARLVVDFLRRLCDPKNQELFKIPAQAIEEEIFKEEISRPPHTNLYSSGK